MQLTTAQAIHEASKVIGSLDGFSVDLKYSGRSMYGHTTAAVIYDNLPDFIAVTAYAAASIKEDGGDMDTFVDDLQKLRFDNMGRGSVAY